MPISKAVLNVTSGSYSKCLPLFVYGTLRIGQPNFRANIPADLAVERNARITGYMYLYHDGPMLIGTDQVSLLDSSGKFIEPGYIKGDIIFLPQDNRGSDLLKRLDVLEGFNLKSPEEGDYLRRSVQVVRMDGSVIDAWTYVSTQRQSDHLIKNCHRINDGDWEKFLADKHGHSWDEDLLLRRSHLLRSRRIDIDPRVDQGSYHEISRLIREGEFYDAEAQINSLINRGFGRYRLSQNIYSWVFNQLSDPDSRQFEDRFDFSAFQRALLLLENSADKIRFSKNILKKMFFLLEQLRNSVVADDYRRNQIRKIMTLLIMNQRVPEKYSQKFIGCLKDGIRGCNLKFESEYVSSSLSLTRLAAAAGDANLAEETAQILVQVAFNSRLSVDTRVNILEDLLCISRFIKKEARENIASKLSLLRTDAPPAVRIMAGSAYVRFMGNELTYHQRRKSFHDLLQSDDFSKFSAAVEAMAATGHEAVRYSQERHGFYPPLEKIIFLEAALMAGRGSATRQIVRRINNVVAFNNKRKTEVERNVGIFALRCGFEIEGWPAEFKPIGLTDESLGKRYQKILNDFGLLTSTDGFGEFASYPSQTLELQAHLLTLLFHLGIFSNKLSYSLHLNLGLPFEVPFYQYPVRAEGSEFPLTSQNKPLYRALSNIWFPLGMICASDERLDNMIGGSDVQSIMHPFRFHSENVLGGDKSRLEHRLFEINLMWGKIDFFSFLLTLHHFSIASLWKELSIYHGDKDLSSRFRSIGEIWAVYEDNIRNFGKKHKISIPDYFSRDELPGQKRFQEKIKRLRRDNPGIIFDLDEIVQTTFNELESVIKYRPEFNLRITPPIISDPRKGII